MADWTKAYARALKIKWTPQVGARMEQWQKWEGGATANDAKNNYMNTKYKLPGSYDAIGNGVQGYATLAQGAMAFARTLSGKDYGDLRNWVATGKGDPSHGLQVWVAGPGGVGSPSAQAYAQKVLGGKPVAPSGDVAQPSSPYVGSTPAAPDGSSVDPMTAVRQTAAQGFADIAQGKANPQDTFSPLLKTLSAARTQMRTTPLPGGLTMQHPVGSKEGSQATNLVKKYLGVKYQWGGESPQTGFDCSGLLQYVWKSLGVNIPRTSELQWKAGTAVDLANLKPGDAVFTEMRSDGPGHVGMYIGNGQIIAAPHTGTVVQVQNLKDWGAVGARRFA